MKNDLLINEQKAFDKILKLRGVPNVKFSGTVKLSPKTEEELRKKLKANDNFRKKSIEEAGHKVIR